VRLSINVTDYSWPADLGAAVARRMWSGDSSAFRGRHYVLERPVETPQPLTRPRPPILVGGAGERKTLRLVARYADACNLFDIPDGGATVRRKLDVLARHCEELGRPYEEIEKTVSTRLEPGSRRRRSPSGPPCATSDVR
jgi:alkanesulfonate monooxygenase SsuD/methylene tetrahydromethanopterin reductase-like flavin-dependent oxidoreductase (luciferase family)